MALTLAQQYAQSLGALSGAEARLAATRATALNHLDSLASGWTLDINSRRYGSINRTNPASYGAFARPNFQLDPVANKIRSQLGQYRSAILQGDAIDAKAIGSFLTSTIRGEQFPVNWSMAREARPDLIGSYSQALTASQQAKARTAELAAAVKAEQEAAAKVEDKPAPAPDAPKPLDQPAPESRDTQRRDAGRAAFGSPRYGVGLNIPLGT
jgi:hypothetical protein